MRSVYTWMTLALVITGFVSMYVAKSYTLLSVIMQNSMAFWGLIMAELGLVWYLSVPINRCLLLLLLLSCLSFTLY